MQATAKVIAQQNATSIELLSCAHNMRQEDTQKKADEISAAQNKVIIMMAQESGMPIFVSRVMCRLH